MTILPFTVQAYILSFASRFDRAFIFPQVCKRWKRYLEIIQNPPLDPLTRKVLAQGRVVHLQILKGDHFKLEIRDLESAVADTLRIRNFLWRKQEGRIVFKGKPLNGDIIMGLTFKMHSTPLEVQKQVILQNIKLLPSTVSSKALLLPNSCRSLKIRHKGKWVDYPKNVYHDELQLVSAMMVRAFKLCVDQIAEQNLNVYRSRVINGHKRFICNDKGVIHESGSTLSVKKELPNGYFDIIYCHDNGKKILVWDCGMNRLEKISIPLGLVFQWAVISKTTKLFAQVLGFIPK